MKSIFFRNLWSFSKKITLFNVVRKISSTFDITWHLNLDDNNCTLWQLCLFIESRLSLCAMIPPPSILDTQYFSLSLLPSCQHMTCIKRPHLQPLNDASVVPGEVHHGISSNLSVAEPMTSVLHHQLGPSEQCLNLALKVCWDCNPTIPCCKREESLSQIVWLTNTVTLFEVNFAMVTNNLKPNVSWKWEFTKAKKNRQRGENETEGNQVVKDGDKKQTVTLMTEGRSTLI